MPDEIKRCGQCEHWKKNLVELSSPDAPVTGNCVAGPPQILVVPAAGGLQLMAKYPPLPEDFPACAQFRSRLEVGGLNGRLTPGRGGS